MQCGVAMMMVGTAAGQEDWQEQHSLGWHVSSSSCSIAAAANGPAAGTHSSAMLDCMLPWRPMLCYCSGNRSCQHVRLVLVFKCCWSSSLLTAAGCWLLVSGCAVLCCIACLADGRGFSLLGAVLWAPLCGTVHWANNKLEAGAAVQAWLVKHDLLDLPQQQQQQEQQVQQQLQQQVQQQQEQEVQLPKVPIRFEDMPWREKIIAVEAVKQRELQVLHDKIREEEQAVLAAALQQRKQQEQQQEAPQRRGWLLF